MNPDAPTLVIDSNFIGYQALHTMGDLSADGIDTGILFGFLSRILFFGQMFETNDLVFCWDSRHRKRRKVFPGYKSARDDRTEEEDRVHQIAITQFNVLRRIILPEMGFANVFMQPGYEADDIIAKIVTGKIGDFVIVSSDEDLYQLLHHNVRIYNPMKRKMITQDRFAKEYRVWPNLWCRVKAIAGCKSDSIPGVPGVGEKTVLKYLRGELDPKTKKFQAIINYDLYDLNMRLVKLPYPRTKEPQIQANALDLDAIKNMAHRYGFESFLEGERLKEWKRFTKGEFDETRQESRARRRSRNVRGRRRANA